jgi:hypothetical protein
MAVRHLDTVPVIDIMRAVQHVDIPEVNDEQCNDNQRPQQQGKRFFLISEPIPKACSRKDARRSASAHSATVTTSQQGMKKLSRPLPHRRGRVTRMQIHG